MPVVKVDKDNPDLLKQPEIKVLKSGRHLFEVVNQLKVVKTRDGQSNKVEVELVCQDDGDDKGAKVFDTISLRKTAEWKLAQFAVACGVTTKEELEATGEIDLDLFKGESVEAMTAQAPRLNAAMEQVGMKTIIARYILPSSSTGDSSDSAETTAPSEPDADEA